jgi:hypothetical protein
MSHAQSQLNQSDPPGSALDQQVKAWTLMVYMVSDQPRAPDGVDLDAPGSVDLDEILKQDFEALKDAVEKLGEDGQVHVAVQIDYLKYPGVFRWSNGADHPTLAAQEGSATDPKVLKGFYEWGLTKFPAKRYALMFWGHSSGPSGLFADELTTFGPAAYSGIETLSLSELGQSVATLNANLTAATVDGARAEHVRPTLEVVIFKDCFQSLLETAFELWDAKADRPLATYMVASQGLIPVALEADEDKPPSVLPTWPYDEMLAAFNDDDTTDTVRNLVTSIGGHYEKPENRADHIDVPIAALALGNLANVSTSLNTLREQICQALGGPRTAVQIEDAFRRAFRGVKDGDPMLVDVSSLCDRLKELGVDSLTAAADALKDCIKKTLVVARRPNENTAFTGVSVYYYPPFPQERMGTNIGLVNASDYEQLTLNKLTSWHTVALAGTPSALARARNL